MTIRGLTEFSAGRKCEGCRIERSDYSPLVDRYDPEKASGSVSAEKGNTLMSTSMSMSMSLNNLAMAPRLVGFGGLRHNRWFP